MANLVYHSNYSPARIFTEMDVHRLSVGTIAFQLVGGRVSGRKIELEIVTNHRLESFDG